MQSLDTRVQGHLNQLRLKELKEVLAHLGLPKVGAKAVLLDRIQKALESSSSDNEGWESFPIASLGRSRRVTKEQVETAVEQVYQTWHKGVAKPTPEKKEARPKREGVVRCVCNTLVAQGSMVQCTDCKVWQHNKCVALSEAQTGPDFRCEACRLAKGDPFSVALAYPLPAAKMRPPLLNPGRGDNMMQAVERTFHLTAAHRELLLNPDHDLQVFSVLLNDPVSLRCHWPQYADLRINGMAVRVTGRQGQQKLGSGGRDDTPSIAAVARDGLNRLSLSAYDDRPFCVGVRIIEKKALEEIMVRVPGPEEGETFDDALARVKRVVAGSGGAAEDSDDELMTLQSAVSVRDPMSGTRISVPGRFRTCNHLACFDLPTLVEINKRARKWQCPHCLQNSSLDDLIVDPYFHRVLGIFSQEYDSENTDLEIGPDGSWRAFLSGDAKKRAGGVPPRWHKPEETTLIAPPSEEAPPQAVKKEGDEKKTGGVLKIRLKRDRSDAQGGWQIDKKETNGGGERPAKLQKTEGEGGSSDRKSDVNKHLKAIQKSKNVVIDLSDSDSDEDVVIAQRPVSTRGVQKKGASQGGGKGLRDLLAAAAAMEEEPAAEEEEVQPRGTIYGSASQEDVSSLWGEAARERERRREHEAGGEQQQSAEGGGFVASSTFDGIQAAAAFSLGQPAPTSPPPSGSGRVLPRFVHPGGEASNGGGFKKYSDQGRAADVGMLRWPPKKDKGGQHPKGHRTNRFLSLGGLGSQAPQRNGFVQGGYSPAAAGLGGNSSAGEARNGYAAEGGFDSFSRGLPTASEGGGFLSLAHERTGAEEPTQSALHRNSTFEGYADDENVWRGFLERERSPENGGRVEKDAPRGGWLPASTDQMNGGTLEPGQVADDARDLGGRAGQGEGRSDEHLRAWFQENFGGADGRIPGSEGDDHLRGGLAFGEPLGGAPECPPFSSHQEVPSTYVPPHDETFHPSDALSNGGFRTRVLMDEPGSD